jgi:hypothetical protein
MAGPLKADRASIAELCRRWRITELAVFGSAVRGDFRPDSDVDVLVSFAPEASPSLFDLARLEEELGAIFGRKVDLIERRAIEHSENYLRRKHILESAQPIHVAG